MTFFKNKYKTFGSGWHSTSGVDLVHPYVFPIWLIVSKYRPAGCLVYYGLLGFCPCFVLCCVFTHWLIDTSAFTRSINHSTTSYFTTSLSPSLLLLPKWQSYDFAGYIGMYTTLNILIIIIISFGVKKLTIYKPR